ncbi:MAG: CRISPR-associated endonuclease Cas2 [Xanthomonadales bacterium]|nr:CRISPR-associated endonuclease Cas2 [Xanthomonadales bacterium]
MYLLVFYDICDKKRLYRVAKLLLEYGIRIQYSVFEMKIKQKDLRTLQKQIAHIINAEDKVHYYPLCIKDLKKRKADGQASVYFIPDYAIVS